MYKMRKRDQVFQNRPIVEENQVFEDENAHEVDIEEVESLSSDCHDQNSTGSPWNLKGDLTFPSHESSTNIT